MRRLLLLLLVVLAAGCMRVEMLRSPGTSRDPNAPVNESSGAIQYMLIPATLEESRAEAYRQMKEACGGPYRIDTESTSGGEQRWRTIEYTCVKPGLKPSP